MKKLQANYLDVKQDRLPGVRLTGCRDVQALRQDSQRKVRLEHQEFVA